MKDSKRKKIEKWIETWEKAELALYRIKINELRATDYYSQNLVLLNEMLQYAFEHRKLRLSSGLVEQQKIFMKLYKKDGRKT
ncbi:MAG: hypothetical protein H8E22_02885 [Candidatus Cloacimonetes bacterium]|nr:hypothetical protein [Candidatus Cloacimonadota bacterium]